MIDVNGLSIQDILDFDFDDINKLSRHDLALVTSRLVSSANKRLKRLQQTKGGKLSPAYQQVIDRGKPFSVKGKNTNQLRAEFADVKKFLERKTSSVRGWNKYQKQVEKKIGRIPKNQVRKFWRVYRKLEEAQGGKIHTIHDSNRIQKMLRDEYIDKKTYNEDDLLNIMSKNIETIYEEMKTEEEIDDETDVFSLEDIF